MEKELSVAVSPICEKDGKKYAFVSFTEGEKYAEGKIPDCTIVSNKGFSDEDIRVLELYMKNDLARLKRMAAGVNVLGAFMKD